MGVVHVEWETAMSSGLCCCTGLTSWLFEWRNIARSSFSGVHEDRIPYHFRCAISNRAENRERKWMMAWDYFLSSGGESCIRSGFRSRHVNPPILPLHRIFKWTSSERKSTGSNIVWSPRDSDCFWLSSAAHDQQCVWARRKRDKWRPRLRFTMKVNGLAHCSVQYKSKYIVFERRFPSKVETN